MSAVERVNTLLTASIEEAAAVLKAGGLVVFPTETVYGLGANALDPAAVGGIYRAKQRPADNPLIVHIHSLSQVDELAHSVPVYGWDLMQAFFPGPLTLLLPKRVIVPDATTAGSNRVCLRMPSLPLARQFLQSCGLPVAAPSANLSGRPSPTRWEDCLEDMSGRVEAILKGPEAAFGLESTIVDCSGAFPVLMRPGSITFEQLARIAPGITLNPSHNSPALPGMRYRHYAPRAAVRLVEPSEHPSVKTFQSAFIGLNQPSFEPFYSFRAASVEDYARRLFSFFRECDRRGAAVIYAERVAEEGLGRALMNRLNKAAAG